MDPSVAEYLASIGMPAGTAQPPAGAVSAPARPSTLDTVLQAALPALGAFLAGRHGAAGSFMTGYQRQQQIADQQRERDRQFQLDQEQLQMQQQAQRERQATAQAQSEARQRQEEARQQAAIEARRKVEQGQIQKSLDEAAKNPLLNTFINRFGPDAFTVKTPLGPMSLAEAQARGAAVPGELGTLPAPPKKERVPLITTPGADGKPVRTEDKPGAKVYERPRKPNAPKEPKKAQTYRYTWKDDDPASDTYGQSFRIVEDENGTIISKTRVTAGTVSPTSAPAAPAGAPKKIGRFTVEVEN